MSNSSQSPGQMTWRPEGTNNTALHLRLDASEPWQHYSQFPEYALPDPPEFSEGYATFLALLKQNWEIVPV
ncbi:MAG: hypothetical protein F6J97_06820 [Leptolyngbya sp. SIO4C1]|nr:hypothetical protein [Leptolyngbya sp. SIO4C1]